MYQLNKKRVLKKGESGAYGTKKYSNPFFGSKRDTRLKIDFDFSSYSKAVIIFFFLIIFSFLWALFFSEYFIIKKIDITGGGKISVDEIRKYADNQIKSKKFIFFSQKNYFLFSKSQFIEFLHSKHSFEFINIKKKYPDSLFIEFNEKPYEITWMEDEKYYYTDRSGGIITEANLLELKERKYPLIHNQSSDKIDENQVTVEQKILDFTISLFQSLKEHENEFEIEKFILDSDINTVKAVVVNGPELYFNIELDIQKQVNKLLVVKREKLEHNFDTVEYVNLKVGDSVYYR
jgi:cell division septal protein FtsQ